MSISPCLHPQQPPRGITNILSNIYCKVLLFLRFRSVILVIQESINAQSWFYPLILSILSLTCSCLHYSTWGKLSVSCRLGSPTMNFFKGTLTILSPLPFHWLPYWNQTSPPNFNIFSRIFSLNSIKATVSQVDKHKHQDTLKTIWSHGWQLPLGHAQHLKNTLK